MESIMANTEAQKMPFGTILVALNFGFQHFSLKKFPDFLRNQSTLLVKMASFDTLDLTESISRKILGV